MYVFYVMCTYDNTLIVIQKRFSEIVEMLPSNCYSTVYKLRKMTNFTDVNEKMSDALSECDDAGVINNQLLSYIINKCAGDVVLLCDVLKNVASTNKKKQLQDLGTYIAFVTDVLQKCSMFVPVFGTVKFHNSLTVLCYVIEICILSICHMIQLHFNI